MYPISDAFRAALLDGHQIATQVVAYTSDVGIAGLRPRRVLSVLDGTVDVDATAAIRRRAQVTLVQADEETERLFGDATRLISPYGNEIWLYRGIVLSGVAELVPLGLFALSDVAADETRDGITIQADGYDRARRVARAKLTAPHTIAAGTNVATAIRSLIEAGVSGLAYSFATTAHTTPALTFDEGEDRWAVAQKLAASIGHELFFDANGVCILRSVPDPETDPVVWTFEEGEQATILAAGRRQSNEGAPNHWIVTGESSSAATPVRGEAKDTNPDSPTYYLGRYGDVVETYRTELATTTQQAQDIAAALLRSSLGLPEQVAFTTIVNPALDVGDVIQLTRSRLGIAARYVMQTLSIPLAASGVMGATVRSRRT